MLLNCSLAPSGPLLSPPLAVPDLPGLAWAAPAWEWLFVKWRNTSFRFSSMQSRNKFSSSLLSEKVLACTFRILLILIFYWSNYVCMRTTCSSLNSSNALKKATIWSLTLSGFRFFCARAMIAGLMFNPPTVACPFWGIRSLLILLQWNLAIFWNSLNSYFV